MSGAQARRLGKSWHQTLASSALADHRLLVALIVLQVAMLCLWLACRTTSAHDLVH